MSLRAFGCVSVLVTADPRRLVAARRPFVAGLRAVDLACSRFRADSELVALNAAGGSPFKVSELLWWALTAAVETARMTAGLVDPTVGRTLRLAGYDVSLDRLRRRQGAERRPLFEPAGGYAEIELDPVERTARLPSGIELDLGASAKALAADWIARAASAVAGGVLVAVGGDIAVAGPSPGCGWPVRLSDDHADRLDSRGPVVAVHEGGLASSSTSVRKWRSADGELHHVFDPRTGRPAASPWRMVSVAAASCLEANAAATAAIVVGAEAPTWLADRGLPARLVRSDGRVRYVAGWPGDEVA